MTTLLIGGVEFEFTEYKEPLTQLPGGVKGYMRGTLPYAVSDGRLPCAFCDPVQTFDLLGQHVGRAHGMSTDEYRDAIGLLRRTRLVSAPMRSRILAGISPAKVERMRVIGSSKMQRRRASPAEARERSIAAGGNAEHLNKRGTCRDQILAVTRAIAKQNGGIVRNADLARQGVWGPSYRRHFPTMKELCAAAGVRYAGKNEWTDAEMLRAFRELAERLGRTPTQKDLGGANGTPSNSTYQARFGGLEVVCERLGLPSNTPPPVVFGDEIDILNRYAILGNVHAVARATHRHMSVVSRVLTKYGVTPSLVPTERRKAREWAAQIAGRLAA